MLETIEELGTVYNIPLVMSITGKLDKADLSRTLQALVDRHESFRTSFGLIDGEPMQIVHDSVEIQLENITGEGREVQDIAAGFVRPFDLSIAPLFRAGIAEFDE